MSDDRKTVKTYKVMRAECPYCERDQEVEPYGEEAECRECQKVFLLDTTDAEWS